MKRTFGEENVRIVILNWFDYRLFDGSNFPMTAGGYWDAAFELTGCRPFGIDLKNTPYGETDFHGAPVMPSEDISLCWQDVADGLIYDAPLYDHMAAYGIEGIVNKEFEAEISRRVRIFFQATQPDVEIPLETAIDEYNIFHTIPSTFKSREEVKQFIREVLDANR